MENQLSASHSFPSTDHKEEKSAANIDVLPMQVNTDLVLKDVCNIKTESEPCRTDSNTTDKPFTSMIRVIV